MYQQLYEHFNSILSPPKQCGFRNGYNAQHCLMVILEKKDSRDKGEEFGAFFTDLSKLFDFFPI